MVLLVGSCNCSSATPGEATTRAQESLANAGSPEEETAESLATDEGPDPGTLRGGPWNARSPLGTNICSFYDWGTELPYVDLFKSSRSWISGTDDVWENEVPVDVDERGWVRSVRPGQIVRTLLLWETTRYRAGKYVVLYDGEGTIEYHEESATRVVERGPGRDVIEVDPTRHDNGILFHITATNPENHVRNVRVLMPGGRCEAAPIQWCDTENPCDEGRCVPFEELQDEIVFNPDFLEKTKRYSVIRYIDWMMANSTTVRRWSDRPTMQDSRWTANGAPPEVMIALSNQLHAEPWVTVPHFSDDDYNRRFAMQVKESLDPSLRVWVELSNEVWNTVFPQSEYVEQQGRAAGLSDDAYEAALRWYAKRSIEILRIWNEVLGENRVVAVLGAQAANVWTGQTILEYEDAAAVADVIAIAPYFGMNAEPDNEDRIEQMTPDQLFEETRSRILPEVFGWMDEYADLARRHNVRLVAYEGGQHFVGGMGAENNDRINRLFDDINRDERMGQLYYQYLAEWRRRGGTLFMNFVNVDGWSMWGRWGSLEYLNQPLDEAPRYRALMRFIDRNPRWW